MLHHGNCRSWGLVVLQTTRLITAIPNDTDPVILVWDLRNANAPERVSSPRIMQQEVH